MADAQPVRIIWLDGLPYEVRPLLKKAAAETLTIIREHPGISVPDIAARRGVTTGAALNGVLNLEKNGYVTTRLTRREVCGLGGNPLTRTCHPNACGGDLNAV